MYEDFFGLSEKPFSIQPDPSFLYWGRGHRLAYAMLEYGVLNHAGISVITGEVGCGKTTLIHRLLDQLSDTHTVSLLSNIQQGRGDLLSWVLMSFGQPFAGKTHVELFAQLQSFFIGEYAKGRRVVLIIDEAQNLSPDMLEELRMLSNINAGKDQLLQLIMVGQPQLKDLLNHPDMLQLAQRIGSDFHLTPLSREEVAAYIETRLTIAGATRRIFTDRAVDVIAEQSTGVPRVINIIADTALVYAFSSQDLVVDIDIVRNVVRDKMEFGVFGYATRNEPNPPGPSQVSQLRAQAAGPTAFIKEESDGSGGSSRHAPERAAVNARPEKPADAPRMTPARRPSPRLVETPPQEETNAGSPSPSVAPFARPPRETTAPAAAPTAAPIAAYEQAARAEAKAPAAAPRVAVSEPAPSPPPQPAAGVGVIVIGAGRPEASLASLGGVDAVIYIADSSESADAKAAARAGAHIVEFPGAAQSPGRARNAGYRQIMKARSDLAYVQFVEAGASLAPGWLETAVKFMERRPEVAIVEGATHEARPQDERTGRRETPGEPGEIQAAGGLMLARAEAFEAAGGYRGDLPVNETEDLCIRLRRRGAHIWRLDAPMAIRGKAQRGNGGWWARAARDGYRYAHGVRLHGAPPERLYVREHARSLIWGAAVPFVVVCLAAVGAGAAQILARGLNPFLIAGAVLGFGAALYLARIFWVAVTAGRERRNPLLYALSATLGHVPEFMGAWRFYASGEARRAGS